MNSPGRDPEKSAYGQVWSDGTFLRQNRPKSGNQQASSPNAVDSPAPQGSLKRKRGRRSTKEDGNQSPDSDGNDILNPKEPHPFPPPPAAHGASAAATRRPSNVDQDHSSNINDAQFQPPSASSGGLGPGIRRPSLAAQNAFFARHPEYSDSSNRTPRWQDRLDELNQSHQDRDDGRSQIMAPTAPAPYTIPVAQMLPLSHQVDAKSGSESGCSFDSLFDERPVKKVNHSKTYRGTAMSVPTTTMSSFVSDAHHFLAAQRPKFSFAQKNAEARLGRDLSVEEADRIGAAWHDVERAITEFKIEAVRQKMM
ncbi:hypothetical protein E2P81_ATG02282 [Venturia nashicola]|uniref:Uncharacterized protein n=1 Tax=Venturia nashicola TaxID=86259 RepID=A0A4Z1PNK2_9PEZI|nr:hypothetical protein E6O75_ATG02339 [Venturia nashicola]TLD36500.1 hypothetical protein E2P81_ATG02282 [Venturia nashicola]